MQNWAEDGTSDCRAEDDRRDAVAVMRCPWIYRSGSGISRANTGMACSLISWPSTLQGARRTRTCCATARSSSSISWMPRLSSARTPSPRVTTRGWISRMAGIACCAHVIAARTRAISCINLARHSWRPRAFRSATCTRTKCAASPRRPACLPRPRRIPPASASSANVISASSFHDTCRPIPVKSAIRKACEVGKHPGVFYYTLGQREGLHIGGVRGRGARTLVCRRQGYRKQCPVRGPGP